jgi:hypothetical protein
MELEMRFFQSYKAARFVMAASIPLAIAATSGVASAQYGRQQQQRNGRTELFEWQGQVDREIRIQFDNRRATVIEVGSNERTRRNVKTISSLPNRDGTVYVQVLQGRGTVDVVQQPNKRNGYTAIVRLRDPSGGNARYRVAAYWEPDRYTRGRNGR